MESNAVEFCWDAEMDRDATIPATDSLLFPHVEFARRPLAEKMLYVGRPLTVLQEDGSLVSGKVEVVCGENIFFSNAGKLELIHLRQVVPDTEFASSDVKVPFGNPSSLSDASSDLMFGGCEHQKLEAKDLVEASLPPVDIIKVGQWFELQDVRNPCLIRVVQVVANRGGLLTVSHGQRHENVFFTNERCHELGWAQRDLQKYTYEGDSLNLLNSARKNAVSSHVFTYSTLREHKFEVGMMLEVLDISNGGVFYAGYVSEVLSPYYFLVRVSQSIKGPAPEMLCHRSHPYIFPVYWCARHNIRLTPPEDYGADEFSWNTFREKCGLTKGSAPEHCFDLPRVQRKFDKLRNVEVLDVRTHDVMYPGKIVRSLRHLVWVHLCHYANATPPTVYSISSGLLFPCGFAKQHGIRMQPATRYVTMGPSLSGDRFNLRTLCTSRQTPVFLTPKKRFLSSVWLNSDLWLPIVYVRKSCFAGPFINPERFRQIPNRYRPGPMPSIIRAILSDLISSAYKPKQICELLMCAKDSTLPQMVVKARIKFKKHRTRVECCEKVTEFCGWLRGICILLDACPDLFGINNTGCESYCNTLREIPSMSTTAHAWTVNTHATTQKSIPRRMRRIVPGSSHNMPSVVRKKKPVIQIYEPRRPLTRAITHKEWRARSAAAEERKRGDSSCASSLDVLGSGPDAPRAQSAIDQASSSQKTNVNGEEEGLMILPLVESNPLLWTASELRKWIMKTDLSSVANVLEKEEIDGEAFLLLSLTHCMENLGLKLGPALKLNALIKELNNVCKERFGVHAKH
uniref:Scm-like with four MBT domains protein 2 n=1 Tax=Ascaris suum TaxID=6253 RepID=F1KWU5_ASCSU